MISEMEAKEFRLGSDGSGGRQLPWPRRPLKLGTRRTGLYNKFRHSFAGSSS